LYLMKVRFRASWDPTLDTFQIHFILIPCAVLSLLITYSYSLLEVMG
jgi:ER lumen protein retaining receptor